MCAVWWTTDEVRLGPFRDLYHPEQLLNAKEDAANNYARCYNTIGIPMLEQVMHRYDECWAIQVNATFLKAYYSFIDKARHQGPVSSSTVQCEACL